MNPVLSRTALIARRAFHSLRILTRLRGCASSGRRACIAVHGLGGWAVFVSGCAFDARAGTCRTSWLESDAGYGLEKKLRRDRDAAQTLKDYEAKKVATLAKTQRLRAARLAA